MEAFIEQIQQWDFYHQLPETIHGFTLERNIVQQEAKISLFSYHLPAERLAFYTYFDTATKDFMAHTVIGLFDFCDIQFIATDLAVFESILRERMDSVLLRLVEFDPSTLGSVFCSKKIMEWDWSSALPESACGFSLFIRPEKPVKIINGSFIIIDYCDFASESNLTVYYNIYRDEFFSERRIRKLPQMLTTFDSKELNDLTQKLGAGLVPALEDMRRLLTD